MILLMQTLGVAMIALALLHAIFPRYFNWAVELPRLSLMNRQMMQVHAGFIALTVFLMGMLAVTSSELLVAGPLGQRISGAIAFFWFCRLLIQWFGYSSELWRGKPFETAVHVVFSALWITITATFAAAALPTS